MVLNSQILSIKSRLLVLEMINKSGASHIGSAFSISDLIAVIYNDFVFPSLKKNDLEYSFVLSKGHAGSIVYATLAELGKINAQYLIDNYYQDGSYFSGHISHYNIPEITLSTGSLGQGVGLACGMALNFKMNRSNKSVICLVGDGECNEGSVWEIIMFANHHNLNNFILIVDQNRYQGLGTTYEINNQDNLDKRFESFGWTTHVIDGHDHQTIKQSLLNSTKGPHCIIANTVKGKGVSFMENNNLWHYKNPTDQYYLKAKDELENLLRKFNQ